MVPLIVNELVDRTKPLVCWEFGLLRVPFCSTKLQPPLSVSDYGVTKGSHTAVLNQHASHTALWSAARKLFEFELN